MMTVKDCIYMQVYYISAFEYVYIRFITIPKILGKTCLKSMLCLFCRCCAFFDFLVLGIGKPFKINTLRLIWAGCGHNSQNLKRVG